MFGNKYPNAARQPKIAPEAPNVGSYNLKLGLLNNLLLLSQMAGYEKLLQPAAFQNKEPSYGIKPHLNRKQNKN